ncbi:MAG: serine/threonine-protein kinase [Planctomycetota bacterium]
MDQSHKLVERLRQGGETGLHAIRDRAMKSGLMTEQQAYGIYQLAGRRMREIPGRRQFGDFEVKQEVGRGSMGVVYKATHVPSGRDVALKVLPPRLGSDPVFLKRFFREARTAARLNHPNVVRALDVGYSEGVYYFAMEYVSGSNLKTIVDARGPVREREALKVCYYMAHALAHAHKLGIAHRDIKPANIIVSREGRVKLCDLGLARVEDAEDLSLTQEGRSVGTPYYMAPEQALFRHKVDERCDLYSLGCTLFYLLTGRPPYVAKTPSAILAKHVSAPVPDPRTERPELSKLASKICRWLLQKRPENRPRSAEALAIALKRALKAMKAERLRQKQARQQPAGVPPVSDRRDSRDSSDPESAERDARRKAAHAAKAAKAAQTRNRARRSQAEAPVVREKRRSQSELTPPRPPARAKRERTSRPELPALDERTTPRRTRLRRGGGRHSSQVLSMVQIDALPEGEPRRRGSRGSRGQLEAIAEGEDSRTGSRLDLRRRKRRSSLTRSGRMRAVGSGSHSRMRAVGTTSNSRLKPVSSGSIRRLRSGRLGGRSDRGPALLFGLVAAGLLLLLVIGIAVSQSKRNAAYQARAEQEPDPTSEGADVVAQERGLFDEDGAPADPDVAAHNAARDRERRQREREEAFTAEMVRRRSATRRERDEGEAEELARIAEELQKGAQSAREASEREEQQGRNEAAERSWSEYRGALATAMRRVREDDPESAAEILGRAARDAAVTLGGGTSAAELAATAAQDLHLILLLEQMPQVAAKALAERVGDREVVHLPSGKNVEGTIMGRDGQSVVIRMEPSRAEVAIDLREVKPGEVTRLVRGPRAARNLDYMLREGIRLVYAGRFVDARIVLGRAVEGGVLEASSVLARAEQLEADTVLLGTAFPASGAGKAAPVDERPEPRPDATAGATQGRDAEGEGAASAGVAALTERMLLRLFEVQPTAWDAAGQVRFRYKLLQGQKSLGHDFEARGASPRYDSSKQVMMLDQAAGRITHKGVFKGPVKLTLTMVFEQPPGPRSSLRIFAERDGEKRSYLESSFGLSLLEVKKGKRSQIDGARSPLREAREELMTYTPYNLVLELDGSMAKIMLDGAVKAHLEGIDPDAGWRFGLGFEQLNAQIREVVIEGNLDLEWVGRQLR